MIRKQYMSRLSSRSTASLVLVDTVESDISTWQRLLAPPWQAPDFSSLLLFIKWDFAYCQKTKKIGAFSLLAPTSLPPLSPPLLFLSLCFSPIPFLSFSLPLSPSLPLSLCLSSFLWHKTRGRKNMCGATRLEWGQPPRHAVMGFTRAGLARTLNNCPTAPPPPQMRSKFSVREWNSSESLPPPSVKSSRQNYLGW